MSRKALRIWASGYVVLIATTIIALIGFTLPGTFNSAIVLWLLALEISPLVALFGLIAFTEWWEWVND